MALKNVPTEVLQLILRYLGTEQNILALMQTNRHFYSVGLPILYQHNIKHSGSSAIHWCAATGNVQVARRFLEFHPDINTPRVAELPPLRLAIDGVRMDMVKLLLDHGARADGNLLLHRAVMTGNKEIVQMLLDSGHDVNSLDRFGHTPLKDAAKHGDRELVQMLLDYGADIAMAEKSPTGVTPLHVATHRETESHELLSLLLDHGANVNALDNSRETPLHWAASQPFPSHLHVLLERGANIEPRNTLGDTPLHCTAMAGMDANMQILCDHGADSKVVNRRGLSPMEVYGELQGFSEEDMPRIG
ncbi:ankyrin [Penicillium capsulatum]|uniref:Ankyrin n=1 Tax=Penicillium capsulatum TaxID=69766 RepID=A0A9W9ISC3_9EURO|nr:ankyrin [Penicillium capsulatum]KAJ6129962.1 ankyrin [Penicillium capsulatum]